MKQRIAITALLLAVLRGDLGWQSHPQGTSL